MTQLPPTRRVVRISKFGGVEQLRLRREAMPSPGPGQLLVEVKASGVNFADTIVRRGEYRRNMQPPLVPGMEAAGRVLMAGPGSQFEAGDHVALFMETVGGYADHVVVDESQAFLVDSNLPLSLVAASFLQGVTAWYSLHRYGGISGAEWVLVPGATGGLGSWTVQLAVDAGCNVVGLASTAAKRDEALALGCSAALDPYDPALRSNLREVVPEGFDVIVDGVGGPLFDQILPCLARNGRYIVVGSATQLPARLDVRHLLPRGQTVAGFVVRNVMDLDPEEPARALDAVLKRAASGRVKVAMHQFPMSEVREAHRLIETRGVVGKLLLDPSR